LKQCQHRTLGAERVFRFALDSGMLLVDDDPDARNTERIKTDLRAI